MISRYFTFQPEPSDRRSSPRDFYRHSDGRGKQFFHQKNKNITQHPEILTKEIFKEKSRSGADATTEACCSKT
jgi:hypothetical protein